MTTMAIGFEWSFPEVVAVWGEEALVEGLPGADTDLHPGDLSTGS